MKNVEKERLRKIEEKIWKLHALESIEPYDSLWNVIHFILWQQKSYSAFIISPFNVMFLIYMFTEKNVHEWTTTNVSSKQEKTTAI